MKRVNFNNDGGHGQVVSHEVGPETKLFFRRYMSLLSSGILALDFRISSEMSLTYLEQARIIQQQCEIPLSVAISGLKIIHENEKLALVDPLTVPWLN
jgi:hypothetical protein